MSTSSYQIIQKLLEFQNSFINLVHSQILAFNQPQQKKQALLKFQILRMSDKNDSFNEMVSKLRKQLIEQKQEADSVLKSYFTKILDLDYLPFLHINRYELTKISIFGFDIYIDPLQAILQILNRLERTFYILEESLKEHSQQYLALQQKGSWQILVSGWTNYYIYLNFYKLSLNIYMLKQYIQIADTSLFKKDKEIIFTGVNNFYKKLAPRLIQMDRVQFLQELADLNNTMYSFHGSFDYFLFYTCLRPQKKLIKVYDRIKDLEKKCKTTNILTPLLFGILNNFKAFKQFLNQVQSPEYIHLLRVLLSGLVINFKLRILEYDQLLELIEAAITKLNLLKGMKFEIITGDLPKEWREAKDFFISAFKSGYNVGEIQTWNLCENQKIQPRIRNYLTEGTLLLQNCKYDEFIKTLEKEELEDILSHQIFDLTSGTQTLSSIKNNWKKITIQQTEFVESKCLNIIRIVNLMNVLENYSQKLLFTTCSAMIQINCISSLLQSVLAESAETINSMITVINRKESISNLKYILPEFHKKYTPKGTFQDIVPVYMHCFIIKQSLQNLLNIIQSLEKEQVSLHIKQILSSLIQKYCPKYQKNFETLENFSKQYKIPYETVHMGSQITSVFTNLTKIISISDGKRLKNSSEMLINLLRYCPWYVISVLNLPSLINQKIQSFLSWMIKSQTKISSFILSQMLDLIIKFSQENQSGNLKEYLRECVYFSVLDAILNFLSEQTKSQEWQKDSSNIDRVINLIEFYVQIQSKFINLSLTQVSSIQQNEGIEKVWYNLLEVLSFILRKCEFSLEKVSRSCQIYWKIIKRIGCQSIGQWYQKIQFNLIFSPLGSENHSSYETFKGITLISSSKNYMTSKQTHGQNYENQNDLSSERYNFSEVKQFFDEKYLSLENHKNAQQNIEDSMIQLNKLAQQSVKSKNSIKSSSIHLMNCKASLPSLSQSAIASIYYAYCNQSNKEKDLANFCLSLLKLNNSNHKAIWELIKGNEKSYFLSQMKFTRETIGQIFNIKQKIEKIIPEQRDQNKILLNMLNLQILSQNVNELELLSSSFYFEAQKIQTFLTKRQQLWFLIVCNNSNWREFNEVFSTYLKNQNFMSNFLQYKEFLTITKKSSKDYEQKIDHFAKILNQYQFYIQKKIEFIRLLKHTDSPQENDIRKSTLLLNVKLALIKCEFERILERMVNVGKLISQNSLKNPSFQNLISSIYSLNNLCNVIAGGNIELPSFIYHHGYLTEKSQQRQFMLGRWLQNVEKVFGDEIGIKYQPYGEQFVIKLNIKEFLGQKESQKQNVMRRVLDTNCDKIILSQQYRKLKDLLKQYFVQDSKHAIQLVRKPQYQMNLQMQYKFYQIGHFLCFQNLKDCQNTYQNVQKVSPLLRSLIKRQILPLQLVREFEPSSYHHLKLILMDLKENDSKVTKKQTEDQTSTRQEIEHQNGQQKDKSQDHFFVWGDKQLIEGGKQIKVNQNNKRQYVDLVAEQVIGKNYLLLNKALALGYINATFINKN